MDLLLNLSSELEAELTAEADRLGLSPSEYALRVIMAAVGSGNGVRSHVRTGKELLSF